MGEKIVVTGGGSAGHVIPSLPIIKKLQLQHWQIFYIGSYAGIERKIIAEQGIAYTPIATGKLRRYFSWQNFIDPFKLLFGIFQALITLIRIKPKVIFSKGGFVAFPVVFAGWLLRIPVIAHESDMTPGLANRLCFPFVKTLCLTFDTAKEHLSDRDKTVVTGTPIREELSMGDKNAGQKLCGFNEEKPCLLVIGGSLGARHLNHLVVNNLNVLTKQFNVIHICGKGNVIESDNMIGAYKAFEYVGAGLSDLYALSDFVISRSGANSVFEILALKKPHIFIPLSAKVSRGDQIANANYFKEKGTSLVLDEDTLTDEIFLDAIANLVENKEQYLSKINRLKISSATDNIIRIITQHKN